MSFNNTLHTCMQCSLKDIIIFINEHRNSLHKSPFKHNNTVMKVDVIFLRTLYLIRLIKVVALWEHFDVRKLNSYEGHYILEDATAYMH